MRLLRVFVVMLCVMCLAQVVAQEPSAQKTVRDGRVYYLHKVDAGQTLYSLAKEYNLLEQQIMDANKGLTAATLKAGEYIFIPCLEDDKDAQDKGKFTTHVVKAGDTIYSIARKYKISVDVLERDNPSIDIDHIAIGDNIKIRRSESGYTTSGDIEREREERMALVPLGEDEHRVVAGETVYSLSRAYGMSEREFMELNGLKRSNQLKAGMVVKVAVAKEVHAAMNAPQATIESPQGLPTMAAEGSRESMPSETIVDSLSHDTALDYFMSGTHDEGVYVEPVEVTFPPLARYHTLKVALMLPFHQREKVNPYYVDLYRGMLLALEDLKADGYNIELSVFDTCGDGNRISDIVAYEDGLMEAQLIIGPVYEAEFRYVLGFAEENDIPVVSPLADIETLESPVLFQMQAENDYRYDKLRDVFDGRREVVTIYSGDAAGTQSAEILAMAEQSPRSELNFVFDRESFFYRRNADGTNGEEVDFIEFMRTPNEKVFLISAAVETDVDRILTTLASTKSAIEGRGMRHGKYVVVGNRRWMQSGNIDHQSFFRNNTIFMVPYHAKRSDEKIRLFDGRYAMAYGVLPSMYSYRGYDAAMIFCRKMFTGIDSSIYDEKFTPLATTYCFKFDKGYYTNTNWVRENYKSNFTIEVQ